MVLSDSIVSKIVDRITKDTLEMVISTARIHDSDTAIGL